MNQRKVIKVLLLFLALFVGVFVQSARASAVTFVVNDVTDVTDVNPGDGICDTDIGLAGDQCSLRAAIQEINAFYTTNPSTHIINFNIPGTGPHTITPSSSFPSIVAPTQILGTTQPGASCPTAAGDPADLQIIIDGSNLSVYGGLLRFNDGADGSVVKGLALNNHTPSIFAQVSAGIYLHNADDVVIQCNYIGMDVDGITARPLENGIFNSNGDNMVVGGVAHADRNIISGNIFNGINMFFGDGVYILNNYIGTDATGMSAVGNGQYGMSLSDSDFTVVGNTNALGGNVIAGNMNGAIIVGNLFSSATVNDINIYNNYIGVAGDGITPLGNGDEGISILGKVADLNIGGIGINEANIIANNAGTGIMIGRRPSPSDIPQSITMRGNHIYNNGGLGIDLDPTSAAGTDGVTLNDAPPDNDVGPNGMLNYPVIETAVTDGSTIDVDLSYAGKQSALIYIDLYINDSCDGSGHGEGQNHAYTDGFITNGSGLASLNVNFSAPAAGGKYLVATATYLAEGTSEFSACKFISDDRLLIVNDPGEEATATADGICDANPGGAEECTLREAILEANAAPFSPVTIEFDIADNDPQIINTSESLIITNRVNIDATTQSGAFCPPALDTMGSIQIALRGTGNSGPGLVLDAGSAGSEIRGLAIYEHGDDALLIKSDDNWLSCNYIGLDASGIVQGNGGSGIHITGQGNLIGGDVKAQRNVIGGITDYGVYIDGADGNYVYGNFIGLGPDGDKDVGNQKAGIRLDGAFDNVIGGIIPSWGNYITFNNSDNIAGNGGISLVSSSDGNSFQNNNIGADINGTADSGNTRYGIHINSSDDNVIGGEAKGNTIVDSGFDGIAIINNSSDGNIISQNSIVNNGGLGIDLGDNGKDTIDNDDLDVGPNGFQNYPLVTAVEALTTKTNIDFTLNTAPSSSYTLEFYASASCNAAAPNDYGEGEIYLGKETVTTNGSGIANGQATVDVMDSSYLVTATATNNNTNDTSEFSQCFLVCDASNQTNPMIMVGGSDVLLTWSDPPGSETQYNIYRSVDDPYNVTTLAKQTTDLFATLDGDGGNPAENHYYVLTVERPCAESEASQTLGEFDFAIVPGN